MSYHHLTREERGKIAQWHNNRVPRAEISRRLGRDRSTIGREIKRNSNEKGRYHANDAQSAYHHRKRSIDAWKLKNEPLTKYITEKLMMCWSPEQIAGRLELDYPTQPGMRVAYSSIYRWLHRELLEQAAALQMNLRHYGHKHGETRGKFHGVREIKERSRLALRRKRLGDWEVDTIVSSIRYYRECLLSVCDRKSRFCGLVLLKRRTAPEVMRGFHFLFDATGLPLETMTGDRGSEFACYGEVESSLHIPFYFARPHSPWQKPSVENQNGLIRQFFPRGTNFHEVSAEEVAAAMASLNNRPRKCLGFQTPAEVLHLS